MKKSLCLGLAIATVVIVASLFVPISTLAKAQEVTPKPATAQTCPIEVKVEGGAFGEHVHFRNVASQPITGIVFHSVRLNAVGEEASASEQDAKLAAAFHLVDRSEQTYSDRKGLAPQAEKGVANNMIVVGRPQRGDRIVTYVRAVMFADGTTWKDDGSHSCSRNF